MARNWGVTVHRAASVSATPATADAEDHRLGDGRRGARADSRDRDRDEVSGCRAAGSRPTSVRWPELVGFGPVSAEIGMEVNDRAMPGPVEVQPRGADLGVLGRGAAFRSAASTDDAA